MRVLGRKLFRPGRSVSTSRVIAAPSQAIFDVLADPGMHPVIDGSGTVQATRGRQIERLSLGATFGMQMKRGVDYSILNTVIEFEEGRRIAWRHFHGHVWRYVLEPVAGGTEVTESFDYNNARTRLGLELVGYPERNLRGMEATLVRLEEVVTASAEDDGRQPDGGDQQAGGQLDTDGEGDSS